jgi:hypothetical protein
MTNAKRAEVMAQVVECLPHKCKTLNSNTRTVEKKTLQLTQYLNVKDWFSPNIRSLMPNQHCPDAQNDGEKEKTQIRKKEAKLFISERHICRNV